MPSASPTTPWSTKCSSPRKCAYGGSAAATPKTNSATNGPQETKTYPTTVPRIIHPVPFFPPANSLRVINHVTPQFTARVCCSLCPMTHRSEFPVRYRYRVPESRRQLPASAEHVQPINQPSLSLPLPMAIFYKELSAAKHAFLDWRMLLKEAAFEPTTTNELIKGDPEFLGWVDESREGVGGGWLR